VRSEEFDRWVEGVSASTLFSYIQSPRDAWVLVLRLSDGALGRLIKRLPPAGVSALVSSLLAGSVHIGHFLARFEDADLVVLLQKIEPDVLNEVVLRLDRPRLRRLLAITSGGLIFPLSGEALYRVADVIRMGDADRFGVFVFMKLLEDPVLSHKVIRKLSSADWRALSVHMPAEEFGRLVSYASRLSRRRLDRDSWATVLAGLGPEKTAQLLADTYEPDEVVRVLGFEISSVIAEYLPALAEFLPDVASGYLDATGDYERVAQVFDRWGISPSDVLEKLGADRTYRLWLLMDGVEVPGDLLAEWVQDAEPWEVPLEFIYHAGIRIPDGSPLYPYAVLMGFEDGDIPSALQRVKTVPEGAVDRVVGLLRGTHDIRAVDVFRVLGRHDAALDVILSTGAWDRAYPEVIAGISGEHLTDVVVAGAGDAVVRAGRVEELSPQMAAMALLAYSGEPVKVSPEFAADVLASVDDVDSFNQLLDRLHLAPEAVALLRGRVLYSWLARAAHRAGPDVLVLMPDMVLVSPPLLDYALRHLGQMPVEVQALLLCAGYVGPEAVVPDVLKHISDACRRELMG